MVVAAPPIGSWAAGIVVWVPLASIAATYEPRAAGALGWLQGVIAQSAIFLPAVGAMSAASGTSAWLVAAGTVAVTLFEGARFGAVALVSAWGRDNGWPFLATFPLALAACLRAFPMMFPWDSSLFFDGAPVLLQTADLAGGSAIDLWCGLASASLALALVNVPTRSPLARLKRGLGLPACVLLAVIGYGWWCMTREDGRTRGAPEGTVAIIQGNFTDKQRGDDDALATYRALTLREQAAHRADLVVWPETALSVARRWEDLPRFMSTRVLTNIAAVAPSVVRSPVLSGAVVSDTSNGSVDGEPRLANAALLATRDEGALQRYDKQSLVWFAEYLPGEAALPLLRHAIPWAGRFEPGAGARGLRLDGRLIMPMICLEDTLGDRVGADVASIDPDLLVTLTSDSWFGQSSVPYLHLAIARLRAIEHRRFLVRAANTGVSAVIDPAGRTVAALPPFERASGTFSVRWLRGRTPYERFRPWLNVVLGLAAVGMCVTRREPGGLALARRCPRRQGAAPTSSAARGQAYPVPSSAGRLQSSAGSDPAASRRTHPQPRRRPRRTAWRRPSSTSGAG